MNFNRYLKRNITLMLFISFAIVLLVINFGVRLFFHQYLEKRILENDTLIVTSIAELEKDDGLNLSNLTALALTNDVYLILYSNQSILYETNQTTPISGMGSSGGNGNGRGMMGRINTLPTLNKNDLIFRKYPVETNQLIDHVSIGRLPSTFSKSNESQFLIALNLVFLIGFLVSQLFVGLYSKHIATKLSSPVDKFADAFMQIKNKKVVKSEDYHSDFDEFNLLADTLEDLSQNLSLQENLRKQLTSDLAHELKNPIAIIRSHIEAFIDGVWEPDENKLSNCLDETLRMTHLIDDLSELTAVESKQKLLLENTDLSSFIENKIARFEPMLKEEKIKLDLAITPNLYAMIDHERFTQVIVNLISNAIKFTPEYGTLNITLEKNQHTLLFKIADTGIGIAPKDQLHIFERFYRADHLRSRNTGGLGIGLSIVKAICDVHGFKISVKSTKDIGTTFIIEIPINTY